MDRLSPAVLDLDLDLDYSASLSAGSVSITVHRRHRAQRSEHSRTPLPGWQGWPAPSVAREPVTVVRRSVRRRGQNQKREIYLTRGTLSSFITYPYFTVRARGAAGVEDVGHGGRGGPPHSTATHTYIKSKAACTLGSRPSKAVPPLQNEGKRAKSGGGHGNQSSKNKETTRADPWSTGMERKGSGQRDRKGPKGAGPRCESADGGSASRRQKGGGCTVERTSRSEAASSINNLLVGKERARSGDATRRGAARHRSERRH